MIKKNINDYHSFHKVVTEDFDKFFKRVSFSNDVDYLNSEQMQSMFMLLVHHKILKDKTKYFDKEMKDVIKMLEKAKHPYSEEEESFLRDNHLIPDEPGKGLALEDIEDMTEEEKQAVREKHAERIKEKAKESFNKLFKESKEENKQEEQLDNKQEEDLNNSIGKFKFIKLSELVHLEAEESQSQRAKYLPKLTKLANYKEVFKPPVDCVHRLNKLAEEMPNFKKLIEDIKCLVITSQLLDTEFKLPNILINGSPGIGKTRFIKKISECLGLERHFISMGGNADTLKIKGLSRGWSTAKPGEVTLNLAAGKSFNPIFCIDEMDKTITDRKDSMHDLPGTFLSYLEEETNSAINDDYIGKDLNMSKVQYIFTTNDYKELPNYFLSRVHVYEIEDMDKEAQYKVVENILSELNEKYKSYIDFVFPQVIDSLVNIGNMREVKRHAELAIVKCISQREKTLDTHHLDIKEESKQKNSIGFF